jgi:protein TonB
MTSADLSLRPVGEGADVRHIFGGQTSTGRTRVLSGTLVHLLAVVTLLMVARLIPDHVYRAVLPDQSPIDLVYVPDRGVGGGGGGGNKSPDPPARAELKGPDPVSVTPAEPPEPTPVDPATIPDTPPVDLAVLPSAGGAQISIGDLLGSAPTSNGRGRGDGDGFGPDKGRGRGAGDDAGTGGGPYQIGNGVLAPRVRRQVDPQYSADAMNAKVQGTVLVAAVVQPDGRVTDIRVVRSLDRSFGLDQKAIEAVRSWEFYPGTRFGKPVPVLVHIELKFNLR